MHFEELHQRIDWGRLYADRLDQPVRGTGEWLSVRCPLHADSAASARISTRTGYFKCFAGCTPDAIPADEIGVRLGWWPDHESALAELAALAGLEADRFPDEPSHPPHRISFDYPQDARDYLQHHGVTPEYARSRGVYWDVERLALAIPRTDHDGSYRGCKYRLLRANGNKFIADKGQPILYGAERLEAHSTRVVVVEGEMDALALQSRMDFSVVVAVPGANVWRDEWTPLLDKREVILCLDADGAGELGSKKLHDVLRKRAKVSSLRSVDLRPLLGEAQKDLGDYFGADGSLTALLELFDGTSPWIPPRLYTAAAEFFAEEPPEEDEALVPGLLPAHEITMLGGESKLGKTYLAVTLGLCVAAGIRTPLSPTRPLCKQGPVWYISEEDSPTKLKRRGWRIARGLEIDPRTLPIYFSVMLGVKVDQQEWLDKLSAIIDEIKPTLLILDTLAAIHDRDENSSSEMARVFYPLNRWGQQNGCTILILHHYNKANSRGSQHAGTGAIGSRLRGSSAIWAAVRGIIGIEGKDGLLEVSAQFNDFIAPDPYLLRPSWTVNADQKTVYRVEPVGTTAEVKRSLATFKESSAQLELARVLSTEFRTVREVREELGWNRDRLARVLAPMLQKRLVEKADFMRVESHGGKRQREGLRLLPAGVAFIQGGGNWEADGEPPSGTQVEF